MAPLGAVSHRLLSLFLKTRLKSEEKMDVENGEITEINELKYLGSILESRDKGYCKKEKILSKGINITDTLNPVL